MFSTILHILSAPRQHFTLRPLRLQHWLALAVCLIAGAGLNVYRTAVRPSGELYTFRGFYVPEGVVEGKTVRWSREYSKAEVPLSRWTPLRWHVELTAPPAAGPQGATAMVQVNDVRVRRVSAGAGWHSVEFVSDVPASTDVAIQFLATQYGSEGRGIGVGRITVEPVFTGWNVFQTALPGAIVAAITWFLSLLVLKPAESTPVVEADAPMRIGRLLALLAILWLCLGIWSVLRPPFQGPDEPQHLVRANSVSLQPWATRTPDFVTQDPRFLNPFVVWPQEDIGQLFFNNTKHLSFADIASMKATTWRETPPPLWPYRTPLATYPTLYYGSVFALAEGSTSVLHLTPYQNTYAYRFWTVILAGLLWVVAYRAMEITPGAKRHPLALLAFLLLNPMLAFTSSGTTPDSVNVPLATLAVLLVYRTMMTGRGGWASTIALVVCGLTKPTFLLVFGSLPLPMFLAFRRGLVPMRHLMTAALAAIRAGAIAYVLFYAWSPPRFFAGFIPKDQSIGAYTAHYVERLPQIWRSYWGVLGWLDYQLTDIWYFGFLALIVAVAIIARKRTQDEAAFNRFTAWLGLSYFVLMTFGEYWYLPRAGYNFQGRHLLPASVAFSGLVVHENRYARWLVLGFLTAMHLALAQLTVARYFTDGLAGLWASLPWH